MSKTLWLKCFLLLSACLFFGCQARSHLSPTFARNYRLLFNNQVQTTRSMTAPLNARDAKAILMKRDERQSGSQSSRGRGRAFSRRSGGTSIASELGLQ